jgi:hypothetical protein
MDLSLVRAKIAEGSLPRTDWDRTRLMVGTPHGICFVCHQRTSPANMAVECQRAGLVFLLHPDCYVLWQEARDIDRRTQAER